MSLVETDRSEWQLAVIPDFIASLLKGVLVLLRTRKLINALRDDPVMPAALNGVEIRIKQSLSTVIYCYYKTLL